MGKPQSQRAPGMYTIHYCTVILCTLNGIQQRLRPQSIHDGYIEVLSFTSYSLVGWLLCVSLTPLCLLQATLQIGGTGDRIGQYQNVRIETTRTFPVQIDGGKYCYCIQLYTIYAVLLVSEIFQLVSFIFASIG